MPGLGNAGTIAETGWLFEKPYLSSFQRNANGRRKAGALFKEITPGSYAVHAMFSQ